MDGNASDGCIDGSDIDAARTSADDELVAELRRVAAEVDPVPTQVVAAAGDAITTRDLDGELATLVADSLADETPDPGQDPASLAFEPVRTAPAGAVGGRLLSFAGAGVQVDLEVAERGGRVEVLGMLTGAVPGHCRLEYAAGGHRTIDVDDLGRFLLYDLERGVVRVRCRSTGGVQVVTAWVSL